MKTQLIKGYSVERILKLICDIENLTGKMFHEVDVELEIKIWNTIDAKQTHKYPFIINQLNHLIDDLA